MIRGKFNVVMDSAWGSSGKGKVASWLAKRFGVTDASSCNMPNAGHTVQVGEERTVYKVLPAASHFGAFSWMGPGAVIDQDRLMEEALFGKSGPIFVHERAGRLQPKHSETERGCLSKISSTMQGSAACMVDKIMRQDESSVWGTKDGGLFGDVFRERFQERVRNGMVLHEVAQGWGLSIDHGTHYPQCTSRNCGVGAALDQMAVPAQAIGDVYLVVRTFPIRVGNTADGWSGGWMADQTELTWDEIERRTGLRGLAQKELTTVTKRVRRVATFSHELLRDCVQSNGATKMVLTFPEYICAAEAKTWYDLPKVVQEFVYDIERTAEIPVVAVSTGPRTEDMVIVPGHAWT